MAGIKRKITGEAAFFRGLWDKMKPFQRTSFVSGVNIRHFHPIHFHHVLPKSRFEAFRLWEENIVLLTQDEHNAIHSKARSDLEGLPEWEAYFELEASLLNQWDLFVDQNDPDLI